MKSANSRDKAVQLLHHYIALTMKSSGLKPDSDTLAEIEDLVDALIDASVETMKEEESR